MKHSKKPHSSAGYHNMTVVLFTLLCVLICGSLSLSLNAQTKNIRRANGKIAFTGGDGIGAIYTTEADGSNVQRLTRNPRSDISPRWSPDGTKIAFESIRDNNGEIYVMNADGSNQTRLTNNPAYDFRPIFSPDGTRIAFGSRRDNNIEIYVMNADGSNQTRLTNDPADDYSYAWSPDSSRIAFTRGGDIYVMNADGTNQTRLTTGGSNGSGKWSPDGTRIAFLSGSVAGSAGISVMNADGSNQTRLTNAYSYYDSPPDWSPDGSRIAFLSNPDNNYDIYVINADGSNQTRLTNDPAFDSSPVFSPDGTRIAFLSNRDKIDNGWDYNDKIYVMNADGSSQTRLTNTAAELYEFKPDWHALSLTSPSCPNPIDCADFFVRQHYSDFLNREPDPGGFNGWLSLLNGCPPNQGGLGSDPACDRVQVSSGFFRSTEFGERGYWFYRYYHAVLGRRPQFTEFVPDMQRLSGFLTPAQEEANRGTFINEFMQRPEFLNLYVGLTAPANAPQFIARLELTAGVTLPETIPPTQPGQPPQFGRTELIQKMQSGELSPGQTLRAFIEQKVVFDAFFYRAFVAMQYFGYLRRDPEAAGYDDWVDVLTNGRGSIRPGDYRYLIFGFVYSVEYRRRFGP